MKKVNQLIEQSGSIPLSPGEGRGTLRIIFFLAILMLLGIIAISSVFILTHLLLHHIKF